MKYYFIAGEASGDLHAANCMRELMKLDARAEFAYTGGSRMQSVTGVKPDIAVEQMAFMGFVDVVKHLGQIRKNFRTVKDRILQQRPDLLVLVDYPGFNLRMAKWAKQHNIKTDFYISPTVWAWKENRVEQIRNFVHRLLVILPFEEPFYQKHNHRVYYVGHPLLDEVEQRKKTLLSEPEFRERNKLGSKPLVAVLPGSREQEIARMLDLMMSVRPAFADYDFVIAGTSSIPDRYYEAARAKGIRVVKDQTYELMSYAKAGIIKSGTSTLESALFGLPQVVCYKAGNVSYAIGKRLVKVKFISLVNLIMGREIVRELIQAEMNRENLVKELGRLLHDESYREGMMREYAQLRQDLGGGGASKKAANYLYDDAITK